MQIIHSTFDYLKLSETDNEFNKSWNVIKDEVNRLTDIAWGYDKSGNKKLAQKNYVAANIYIYLQHLAIYSRHYMIKEGKIKDTCNTSKAFEKYKYVCIEDHLTCLSVEYGGDYNTAWRLLKKALGITRMCRKGIGSMVITNDFIVG